MAADSGQEPANALNTSQSVLQYFWDLASYDEEVRLAAARGLVADVIADQAKHNASLGKDNDAAPEEGAPKQKQLEYHLRRCSPTMVYTLRRLARGLASSRQAARQGYATALAGLLAPSAKTHVTPAGVMVLLEVCVDGPVKGGDAKDTLLARLFGYGALLRSGLPLESHMLATLFNGLLEVGARKSFLREAAASVALEAAARMDKAGVAAVAAPAGPLAAMLSAPPAEATPEALLLALVLWPKLPPAAVKACKLLPAGTPPPPTEVFSSAGGAPAPAGAVAVAAAATAAGLFGKEHVKVLQPVLLATSASHPRLHTLWHYLLPLLLPGFRPYRAAGGAGAAGHDLDVAAAAAAAAKGASAAAGKGAASGPLLESFWSCVVEGGLMDSSHERRYLGFQLFARCLPHLRPEHVATVFSPALTRTLTNAVKRRDSYLHASARRLLDGISGFLERSDGGGADGGVKMAVAAALQRLGGMAPKELAAGKLTQKLVQGMDADGVHRYVSSLMTAFLAAAPPLQPGSDKANGHAAAGSEAAAGGEGEEDAAQSAADRRGQCVEQLLATLRFPAAAEGDAAAALRFLALHAFVAVEQPAKAAKSKVAEVAAAGGSAPLAAQPLTPSTRGVCASRLVTLMAHLGHNAQAALRTAQQQQGRKADAGEPGAGSTDAAAPSAKKRKTASGVADAGGGAAAAGSTAAASPASVHAHLHSTLAFLRDKALKAPGVALAKELGEEGESALGLLAAIEAAALEKLAPLDAAAAGAGAEEGGKVAGAGRLRSLAALCAHLQLSLLSDPEGFEMDLPLSLRRVAAEGLGLEGLPEVEEEQVDEEQGGKEGGKEAASWCDVLVDVLLALMARPQGTGPGSLPSAPLREAAEALWRGCCDGLRAEGLQDIVRVVAAGGKGEGQDAAGLYESDEEEEDDEEEELEEDEAGSEEEEEDEESEDEAAAGAKAKKAAAAAEKQGKRKAAGEDEGDEGDEEEDEGMDDEAMFRMDDKLAAYFKSMAAGRAGGQAAAERAAALLNFRLRALALLEVFAKKSPNSPLLLAALVPLVRALATAARPGGQPQVADRLKGVIMNKLSKCRCAADVSVLGGLEGYAAAAKRLLYEASRNKDRVTAGAALAGYTALLRAGAAAEDAQVADAARASFRAALGDLLTSKKTRLQPDGLAAAFRAAPGACLPAGLELLLAHVSTADKARNAHARVAAAELLSRVVRAPPEGLAAALTAGGATGLGGAFGAALAACAAGVGLKREHHGRAASAAAAAAEAMKRLLPAGKRAAEVLGADKLNAIAKAVVTVQSLAAPPKVSKPLKRLAEALALGPLLEKTQPDPALASRITKARPDKQAAAAAKATAQKGEKGKGKGEKAVAAKQQGAGEKKGQMQEPKKRKPEEEEDDEDEDDDEGDALSDGDDEEVGMSDEEEDDDGPSGSGASDEEDDEEEEEEEDEKPKRGKGGATRGGKFGGGGGKGKGGPKGGKSAGGGGGKGGKGQGRPGGKQGGRGGKAGGSPAKKARR